MAYPLSAPVVQKAYDTIKADLDQLKNSCQAVQTAVAGGASAEAWYALNAAQAAVAYRTDFAIITANPALVAQLKTYVQQQVAGATGLAVDTEYGNINTLANNLLNAAASDYPHDAQGRLLDRKFNLTTGVTWLTFTAAQAPNFMPAVTALLAAFA